MTDADRTRVEEARADEVPEWEVFLRESACEPLRHAGSVTAPSAEVAHEQASTLFPEAGTLWLCRSDGVARFAERNLGAEYESSERDSESDADATAEAATADAEGGVES